MISMVDYGALPPEVNSGRIYAGPKSGPMLAAASAWDQLATELYSTASAYQSVVFDLTTDDWLGPASRSLSTAITPYVAWMSNTALQAELIANQAASAAAAYEVALAGHVPPTAIAANRTRLVTLLATNILGQNTPAITATEAQYEEMWAQDAAAMYQYAGASATASEPRPFTRPPQTTDPAGQADQAVATTRASSNATGTVGERLSELTSALHQLASPVRSSSSTVTGSSDLTAPNSNTSTVGVSGLLNTLDGSTHDSFGTFLNDFGDTGFPAAILGGADSAGDAGLVGPIGAGAVASVGHSAGLSSAVEAQPVSGPSPAVVSTVASTPADSLGGTASAGMNRANFVGALSVPESWSAITSANMASPPTTTLPTLGEVAEPEPAAGMPGMPGIPAAAGAGERTSVFNFGMPRYGFRPSMMPKNTVG